MLGMGKRIAFEKTKNVGLIFPFFQGRVQTMMNPFTFGYFSFSPVVHCSIYQ